MSISAIEALDRLVKGNRRFVSGEHDHGSCASPTRRKACVGSQDPFAIIVGCSDSRVPPEFIFDQGLGDLFVIRVAGNIVAPSQIGSVEFAAAHLGVRLVVVLGHSNCGAIQATFESLSGPGKIGSPNLQSIIDRIRPSVAPLVKTELRQNPDALMSQAVRLNVCASTAHLRHETPALQSAIQKDELRVVGAEYDLETGWVDFFDGMPDAKVV